MTEEKEPLTTAARRRMDRHGELLQWIGGSLIGWNAQDEVRELRVIRAELDAERAQREKRAKEQIDCALFALDADRSQSKIDAQECRRDAALFRSYIDELSRRREPDDFGPGTPPR